MTLSGKVCGARSPRAPLLPDLPTPEAVVAVGATAHPNACSAAYPAVVRRPNVFTILLGDDLEDFHEPTAADLRQKRRETVDKLSAELGDWLLRCNGGEGMSQCVSNLFLFKWATLQTLALLTSLRDRSRRSDMDFMFQFMKKMSKEQLSVSDLHFSSHTTFRKYVDKLCGQENSGWIEVKLPVAVEGFPHLKAR